MASEPEWLRIARGHLGLAEIPGRETAPTIRRWLLDLKAWWSDDEAPWCGVALAAWMRAAGLTVPAAWYRAKSWASWGIPLGRPAPGAVVVFERSGGGHVGLIVGRDLRGRLLVLGGNQGNRVSIAPFDVSRVIAIRWPHSVPIPTAQLAVLSDQQPSSTQEA